MKKLMAPYIGDDKYAFVSYCHKDEERVYPIICELMNNGGRIWYDAAINPGLEWPEVIAERLSACIACIAFVSEASLMSHNCRKEINFALMKNKPLLIVMLDDAKLSPGMEMQLSTVQSILAYHPGTDVFSALKSFDALSDCFGNNGSNETVPFSEILTDEKDESDNELKSAHDAVAEDKSSPVLYLERVSSGQCIYWKDVLTVGRSTDCGYPLSEISEVSFHHAELSLEGQRLYVTDCGSTNGTFINDVIIDPKKKLTLECGDEICFASEKFIVRQGRFEKCERIIIEEIRKGKINTFSVDAPIIIGYASDRCNLSLSYNKHISREHLRVEVVGKEIFVTDLNSINGSYIQGKQLIAGEKYIPSFAITIADEPLYIAFEPDKVEE